MYFLSTNKNFMFIFFKKNRNHLFFKKTPVNIKTTSFSWKQSAIKRYIKNNLYTSKIYICKHSQWLFVYLFTFLLKKKYIIKNTNNYKNVNSFYLYQIYYLNKYLYKNYNLNNISKKNLSINQSHLSIEYANLTMSSFKKNLYGFGNSQISFFSQKFEKHQQYLYENFKKKYKYFNKKINKMFPIPIALHKKHILNIYLLDMIHSYKGVRHARGLPCRGQRTWTNAWTSYRTNTVLRVFKIKLLNRVYKKIPFGQINTYYLAEQINLLWKVFWKDEWLNARKKVIVISKKKNYNIDVSSMAKGNVVSPSRLKKMSKKQKSSIGKNTLTLGFDIGFTKKVLTDLYKRNKIKQLKTITPKKSKKKKIDIKTKIIKHRLKKKSKKSVWD